MTAFCLQAPELEKLSPTELLVDLDLERNLRKELQKQVNEVIEEVPCFIHGSLFCIASLMIELGALLQVRKLARDFLISNADPASR